MIIGKHPPTENTPGIVGQEYFDDSSDTTYICTDVKHVTSPIPGEHDAKYVWKAGGSGGASSWNDLTDKPMGIFCINASVSGSPEGGGSDNEYYMYYNSWSPTLKGAVTVDKTYQEISLAMENGLLPVVLLTEYPYSNSPTAVYHICTLREHAPVSYDGRDENIWYTFDKAEADNYGAYGVSVTIRKNGDYNVTFSGHNLESILNQT